MTEPNSRKTIIVAIAANFSIAIIKFIVALTGGSSAMLSESFHSLVDTGNELLLLQGLRASNKAADDSHPFGYGQELYFWTLIVAFGIFAIGGGVSIYEGINHVLYPHPIENPEWNYVVLGLGFVIEGYSWQVALKEFAHQKGDKSFWQGIRSSKDPTVLSVLLEDSAALLGLTVALIGIFLGHQLENPLFDGIASILIGLILCAVAILLGYESKELLIGEGAFADTVSDIQVLTEGDPDVAQVLRVLTLHFGPNEILLNLELEFRDGLSVIEAAIAIDRVESTIRDRHPQVKQIFVEVKSLSQLPEVIA